MGRRTAAVVLVIATPIAAWYAMGRLDEPGAFPDPDHAVTPPDLPLALEWVLGLGAGVAVAISLVALVRRRLDREQWVAVVAAVLGGTWVAFVGRVATSAVTGANIGFGLLVLLTPLVAGGLAAVAFGSLRARRRPGRSRGVVGSEGGT